MKKHFKTKQEFDRQYCFPRMKSTGRERMLKKISDEDLDNRLPSETRRFVQMSDKYYMLEGDHTKQDFELTKEQYDRIVAELTEDK